MTPEGAPSGVRFGTIYSANRGSVITRVVVVMRCNVRARNPGTRHIPISHMVGRPPDVTRIGRCSVVPVRGRGDDSRRRRHRGRSHNHWHDRWSYDDWRDRHADADADRDMCGGARLGNTQPAKKNRQTRNPQHRACHIAPMTSWKCEHDASSKRRFWARFDVSPDSVVLSALHAATRDGTSTHSSFATP